MRGVVFGIRSFAAERNEVLEERRETDRNAEGALREATEVALFRGTALAVPVLGLPVEFDAIGAGEAAAFYQSICVPSNAFVVIAVPLVLIRFEVSRSGTTVP